MLRHVVLFNWKPETPPEKIREIEEAFCALPAKIPEIAGFEWGTDVGVQGFDQGFTHCFVVSLASDDLTEIAVPATVTITAGQTSADFDLTVVDDSEIDGTQTAMVTASAVDWTSSDDSLDITDNETQTITLTVPASATEGAGVLSGQGQISIPGTFASDVVVTLSSNDTSEATVPPSVTITSGQTFVTFDITVQDDPDIDGAQTATITGQSAP